MKKNKKAIRYPKIYQLVGQFLQFISVKWASKYAIWFFFFPMRFPMPEREKTMDSASRQHRFFVPSIGKEINLYEYGQGEKRVLLTHGWSGRGTQLFTIADYFVDRGYKVISFDAPAHGKSKGNQTNMKEFVECILAIGNHYGHFQGIVGHSLGAMSSINAVARRFKTDAVVAIAGGNTVEGLINDFINTIGMNSKVGQLIYDFLIEILGSSVEEYSVEVAAKKVEVPLFIIHDKDDIDVPIDYAYELKKAVPDIKLMITEGLGHRRILADEAVVKATYSFIEQQIKK